MDPKDQPTSRNLPGTLREHAYDEIRDAIISGELAPGERIKERHIAEQLQISTTPVKEALRRLEQEGLVTSAPRRGAVVSDVALTTVEEIVEIRAVLEGLAARFAAVKTGSEFNASLESQLAQMDQLTEQYNSIDQLVAANTAFHQLIRDAGSSPFIHRFLASLEPFDRSVRRQALSNHEEARRGYQEHMGIANAIMLRNAADAEHLMHEHIRRTIRFVVEHPSSGQRNGSTISEAL